MGNDIVSRNAAMEAVLSAYADALEKGGCSIVVALMRAINSVEAMPAVDRIEDWGWLSQLIDDAQARQEAGSTVDKIKARADAIAHLTVPEDDNYKNNGEYRRHFRIARDAALAAFEEAAALSGQTAGRAA